MKRNAFIEMSRALALVVALLVGAVGARATNYAWTNTADGTTGYWTNGVLWGGAEGSYPINSTDIAYLTNAVTNASYTVILDVSATLTNITFSNGAATPHTVTLIINTGASLIASNAIIRSGSSSVGNTSSSSINLTLDNGALSTFNDQSVGVHMNVTNTVLAGSGGGTWILNGKQLAVGNGGDARNDKLTLDGGGVPGGLVVTNVGSITVGAPSSTGAYYNNLLLITNGAQVFSKNASYVGMEYLAGGTGPRSNGFVVVTDAGSVWDLGGANLYIGTSIRVATNNEVQVLNGGTLRNGQLVINSVSNYVASNGLLYDSSSTVNLGITVGSAVAGVTNVLDTTVTTRTATNQLVLPAGVTSWNAGGGSLSVGAGAGGSNNYLRLVNGTWTNFTQITVGGTGSTMNNSLVIDGTTTLTATKVLANNTNTLSLLGGTLNVTGVMSNLNNSGAMTIGNGTQAATLNLQNANRNYFAGGLTISANATLKGGGTVVGATMVNGTIAPGNSIGTMTFSNALTLASTATAIFELATDTNGGNGGNDKIAIGSGGSIALGSAALSLSLDQSLHSVTNGTQFLLIDNQSAGSIGGTFAGYGNMTTNLIGGVSYAFDYSGGSGNDLVLTVVPEPSALVLVGVGLVGTALFRRWRKLSCT